MEAIQYTSIDEVDTLNGNFRASLVFLDTHFRLGLNQQPGIGVMMASLLPCT